jgi:predicted small integral membrane protein
MIHIHLRRIFWVRLSQIGLVVPCALREWINMATDIEQFHRNYTLSLKIIQFPVAHNVDMAIGRAVSSPALATAASATFVLWHALAASLMTAGAALLLRNIHSSHFTSLKLMAQLGLVLAIIQYVTLLGLIPMDFFMSWMQDINFDTDLVAYAMPNAIGLFYLCLRDP